ncbi:MAG: DedA family protein [Deltaproteobacteria bacterium]|nr:DedA family protein [Deltaproteobacteria bacterium]MBW1953621.1 DedA family protein [Deltaproteobacteria bacterium]MBW1987745.1 DedA family protein [Deltaproteobacteria bacterium]MBW2135699.1 DedA family protein [Deltaproteobacteria bacterium]
MGITETLLELFTRLISTLGYGGVFVLMTLESMVAPVPSEMVMPFAGFLIFTGQFHTIWVIVASGLGSIVGSLLSYGMGRKGEAVVLRYGRYLLLNPHHLQWTEDFFARHGKKTIFISRFIPVVRHLISIPAGLGKMRLLPFIVYTAIGATMWNGFLTYMGYWLRQHWAVIHEYSHTLDLMVIGGGILALAAYLIWRWRRLRPTPKAVP